MTFIKIDCEHPYGPVIVNTDSIRKIYLMTHDDHRLYPYVVDMGPDCWERVTHEEYLRISALLLGDTPAPVPTPAESVDDAWWKNLWELINKWADQFDAVSSDAVEAHVRTYNAPALPADAVELIEELDTILNVTPPLYFKDHQFAITDEAWFDKLNGVAQSLINIANTTK